MTIFKIEPDWQHMDTAPKDGRTIVIATASAGFDQDIIRTGMTEVYWGHMKHYPDMEKVWLLAKGDGNTYIAESEWTIERHLSNEYGQEREHNLYRGSSFLGWAEPWTVEVEMAKTIIPARKEVIYDNRGK